MQRQLRIVLLTGDGLRHKYVATRLAQSTNLVGIVSEAKSEIIAKLESLAPDDQQIIRRHFAERDEAERRLLGERLDFPDTEVQVISNGAVNSPQVLDWLQLRSPDLVMLYGSGMIKSPLLDLYSERMVNLHLGLSPYYRGSGTNFWPLVYGEPECVGATIHLAVERVDAGAILAQIRPTAERQDRAHDLGTKTIMAALDSLPEILNLFSDGRLITHTQDLSQGRTFRQRDFNANAVSTMWRNLEDGMVTKYLADEQLRREKYPIVEWSSQPAFTPEKVLV